MCWQLLLFFSHWSSVLMGTSVIWWIKSPFWKIEINGLQQQNLTIWYWFLVSFITNMSGREAHWRVSEEGKSCDLSRAPPNLVPVAPWRSPLGACHSVWTTSFDSSCLPFAPCRSPLSAYKWKFRVQSMEEPIRHNWINILERLLLVFIPEIKLCGLIDISVLNTHVVFGLNWSDWYQWEYCIIM